MSEINFPNVESFLYHTLKSFTRFEESQKRIKFIKEAAELFGLTQEQMDMENPSGNLFYKVRIGHALSKLKKFGYVDKDKKGKYFLTDKGKEFWELVKDHDPEKVTHESLKIGYVPLEETTDEKEAERSKSKENKKGAFYLSKKVVFPKISLSNFLSEKWDQYWSTPDKSILNYENVEEIESKSKNYFEKTFVPANTDFNLGKEKRILEKLEENEQVLWFMRNIGESDEHTLNILGVDTFKPDYIVFFENQKIGIFMNAIPKKNLKDNVKALKKYIDDNNGNLTNELVFGTLDIDEQGELIFNENSNYYDYSISPKSWRKILHKDFFYERKNYLWYSAGIISVVILLGLGILRGLDFLGIGGMLNG